VIPPVALKPTGCYTIEPHNLMPNHNNKSELGQSQSQSQRPQVNVGSLVIADPTNAVLDLVFVHGIQGHREETWTGHDSSGKAVFWPRDLLSKNPNLADVRILTLGYDTQVDKFFDDDHREIYRVGNELVEALSQERQHCPTRPLIFVAHSWGGVLVKGLLLRRGFFLLSSQFSSEYSQLYESTKGVVFIGTPHRQGQYSWQGLATQLAIFALHSPPQQLEKLRREFGPHIEENFEITEYEFLKRDAEFKIHSFYETRKMDAEQGGVDKKSEVQRSGADWVVQKESAIVGNTERETSAGINGDHLEICKFSVDTDSGYQSVLQAIEGYVKAAR
jgi:hypothetical protein